MSCSSLCSKFIPSVLTLLNMILDGIEKQNPAIVGFNDELTNPTVAERRKIERKFSAQGGATDVESLMPMPASLSAQGPQRSIQEDLDRWGIKEFPTVEVTKEMLVMDMRSKLLQGIKAIYAEWLGSGLMEAKQSFDLKEATDKVV